MKEFEFCPACLSQGKLSLVRVLRKKQECIQCGAKFPLNAVLISEDVVRVYVREQKGAADHLLKELEQVGKDPSWFRRLFKRRPR